jgi:SNF2 family DNA or RNA helicase
MALVFQVETGSLAITLTASAHILFYSLPDSWATYFQALSRVDRIGQTRSISHYYLQCPGTLDAPMLTSLREKRDMHAELMGNPAGFLLG